MNREKVIELLKASALLHARDAITELPEFIGDGFECVPSRNLLSIYEVRAELLSNQSGAHASQLHKSIKEFVSNLKNNRDAEILCIPAYSSGGPHYLVFIADTNEVVGCLKVVSQLNVSKKQWQELWKKS